MYAFTACTAISLRSHFTHRPCTKLLHVYSQKRPAVKARIVRSKTVWQCQLEPLLLSEDSVNQALDESRTVLSTIFDKSVGITGQVHLASLDGPIVVLRLEGRFWHKRTDVLARISAYIEQRIPEVCGVEIEDPAQLNDYAE